MRRAASSRATSARIVHASPCASSKRTRATAGRVGTAPAIGSLSSWIAVGARTLRRRPAAGKRTIGQACVRNVQRRRPIRRRGRLSAAARERYGCPKWTVRPRRGARWRSDADASERARPTCRSVRRATCGCTSRGWAPTADAEIPVIVRGEGCHVYDEPRPRATSTGCRRCTASTSATAARSSPRPRPSRRASSRSSRTGATRTRAAIELAERIARLAPPGLERVFFTSGGSEAVESAWKLARAYHRLRGEPQRTKIVARELAYHGTSMGALAITGLPDAARTPFEPRRARRLPRRRTPTTYRWAAGRDPLWAADAIEAADPRRGPRDRRRGDPRAGPERRRLLRAAGRATSPACARSATATACC